MKTNAHSGLWLCAPVCLSVVMLAARPCEADPLTQCIYSGPFETAITHSSDPPLRFELDADGRGVALIHAAQTNYDRNNPFKPAVMGEKATCRLKLDCAIQKDDLKSVSILSTTNMVAKSDTNVWVQVGADITFKYSDESHNRTCHVTGVELL
jgi:hypothetical protein